ncbi:MAG TPA: DUF2889 domain-containing protein [Acidimicrobiales bacterium]|nr:DUF2889 domain-containing protein [Acidimicrobiales bacterium]
MLLLPELAGPHDPTTTTPPRLPGSVRRTSSIDISRPFGILGDLVVEARARDLLTRADATPVLQGIAHLRVTVDGKTRNLTEFEATPPDPALEQLLGVMVGPGFRGKVDEALPHQREAHSLLYLLLDDLPGASLISGYAMLRGGAFEGMRKPRANEALFARADMCAGWASDATMMVTMRAKGENPTPVGPPAPVVEPEDDPLACHPLSPLPPHAVRRRRRLDVVAPRGADELHQLDIFFRDSHVDAEGLETVLHEYTVHGNVDAATRRIVDLSATAQVLPWTECPGALGSAARLVGEPLEGLRPKVRQEFSGVTTCTHLNDTLRGITDVGVLIEELGS